MGTLREVFPSLPASDSAAAAVSASLRAALSPGGSSLGSPGSELLLSHLPGAFAAVTVHISPGSLPPSLLPSPRNPTALLSEDQQQAQLCKILSARPEEPRGAGDAAEVQERCLWSLWSSMSSEHDVEGQVTVRLQMDEGSDKARDSDKAKAVT